MIPLTKAAAIPSLETAARPFLKWVGGKSQLIPQLRRLLPLEWRRGESHRYFEPFMGGAALFFHLHQQAPQCQFILSDENEDLVNCYRALQANAANVIEALRPLRDEYVAADLSGQKEIYYRIREAFNSSIRGQDAHSRDGDSTALQLRAAQLIFLNKTCFNGLYRVNRRGEFNTPSGAWKKNRPLILDEANLLAVGVALQNTRLELASYLWVESKVRAGDFVYFDPPYRPLSSTSSFESYTAGGFGDAQQVELANLFRRLDAKGARLMLSNSDSSETDPENTFFTQLYAGYFFHRVQASRMVNSRADRRGKITELVITNYAIE